MSEFHNFEVDAPRKPNSLLRTLWYETNHAVLLSHAKEFWAAVQRECVLPDGLAADNLAPKETHTFHELYYFILLYMTVSPTVCKQLLTNSPLTIEYIQNYWNGMICGVGVNNTTAKNCTERMFNDLHEFVVRISNDIRSLA